MAPADPPAILPILLKLVDGCQNSELQEQSATVPRTAALSRKEYPLPLWCSPRPSAYSADQKRCSSRPFADQSDVFITRFKRKTSPTDLQPFRSF